MTPGDYERDMSSPDPDTRARAALALGPLGGWSAESLLTWAAMHDPSPKVRSAAAEALVRMGPAVVPYLTRCAEFDAAKARPEDQHPRIPPKRAAAMLMQIAERAADRQDPRAPGALTRIVLSESPPACRAAAVRALGALRPAEAIPVLIEALGDRHGMVRQEAIQALGALGAGAAEPLIREPFGEKGARWRAAAAQALGLLRDPRAIPILLAQLDDPDSSVRRGVARALGGFGAPAVSALLRVFSESSAPARLTVAQALQDAGESALAGGLQAALRGDARRLVRLRDPRATAVLIAAMGNPSADVRAGAMRALDALGEEPLASAVRSALDNRPEPLVALGDPRAVAPLLVALRRAHPLLQQAAALSLARMGVAAAAALQALSDIVNSGQGVERDTLRLCRDALRSIREALEDAPAEMEAATAPAGSGTELESAPGPAAGCAAAEPAAPAARERPWWQIWRRR